MMGMMRHQGRKVMGMKTRLALLAAGSAALFMVGAAPASADAGPHHEDGSAVTDGCAACHRVHTAKAPQLLKEDQSTLCLSCHGTTGTGASTNVVDGLGYSSAARSGSPGALRGGGFSFARIGSGAPTGQSAGFSNADGVVPVAGTGSAVTSTHSISSTSVTAWGNGASGAGATIQLRCGSCHDPHGNGNYRILRDIPKESGGTSTTIADAGTKDYTTTNYWQVNDTNASSYIGNVSAWCTTCHTRYLAPSGSGSTDSGDAIFKYRHKSNGTTQGSTSCIQCHVSHGSNASMGPESSAVEIPGSTVAANSSRLLRIDSRGTCQMCHNR